MPPFLILGQRNSPSSRQLARRQSPVPARQISLM